MSDDQFPDGSSNYSRDPRFYTQAAWETAIRAAEAKQAAAAETARKWADIRDRLNALGYPVWSNSGHVVLDTVVWQRLLRDLEAYHRQGERS